MLDYSLALVTPPAVEPVTLAEAKRHANVVASDDDDLITALVVAAREMVERDTGRALVTQTWRLKLHEFFGDKIELPHPPLQSVTSITYLDTNDDEQTLATSYYDVDTDREPGVVWRDEDAIWPSVSDEPNAVTITYVAGYGDAASDVPQRARQAILLLVGHWYRAREAVGRVGDPVALAYEALVQSLRVGVYP